ERADRVHDEHHLGIFLLERGDFSERTHHAGGGFVVNEREGVELAGGEFGVHLFNANRRAPRHLERLGGFAAASGDIGPFVGESAAHAVQRFFGDQVADGAFHHAPGGGSAQKDQLPGV